MLYNLEGLRHNEYHANTSTWTNQKGYRTTVYFILLLFFKFLFTATGRNAKRLYTLEALSNNKYHSRIFTWMSQKGYRTTAYFFFYLFYFFFTATGRNAKRVVYPRSAQA